MLIHNKRFFFEVEYKSTNIYIHTIYMETMETTELGI